VNCSYDRENGAVDAADGAIWPCSSGGAGADGVRGGRAPGGSGLGRGRSRSYRGRLWRPEWVDAQFDEAKEAGVGCGFITWSLERAPELLDHVLERDPRAILLSFGDPRPFAPRVREAGVPLLCQVQSRPDAELALEAGADVIVAQGAEAGGHGDRRATFTLLPEIADLLGAHSAQTLVCAAGGIADGRGVAAALVLGADGVLVGSRLWATVEANVADRMQAAAVAADGDGTIRTSVMDIARGSTGPSASRPAYCATASPTTGTAARPSCAAPAKTSAGSGTRAGRPVTPTARTRTSAKASV